MPDLLDFWADAEAHIRSWKNHAKTDIHEQKTNIFIIIIFNN